MGICPRPRPIRGLVVTAMRVIKAILILCIIRVESRHIILYSQCEYSHTRLSDFALALASALSLQKVFCPSLRGMIRSAMIHFKHVMYVDFSNVRSSLDGSDAATVALFKKHNVKSVCWAELAMYTKNIL